MICGIDLGTTNSAVSIVKEGNTIICKNLEQADVTPSVVHIDRKGRIRVGKRAYNRLIDDPDNVAAEFKRLMGYREVKHFDASGKKLTPEKLSAEVLKFLLNDAYRATDEEVTQAVIGVPAAFGHLQCEATRDAAELAGLKDVIFLQEPIAASVAYGFDAAAKGQRWLVYDLGGGTFDAAVVSIYGDRLSVLAHQGNNALGGKDFDELIIKNIFLPYLEEYELPESDSESFRGLYQGLKRTAEEVKIILSQADETTASIFDVGEDLSGKEIEFEISVTRKQLEELATGKIEETIELCRKALKEAGLQASGLDRIILVGGPTYMPMVRRHLNEAFGLPLSFSIDPMTVVARGAALYAIAQRWEGLAERKPADEKLDIALKYPSMWPYEECRISGKIEGKAIFDPSSVQLLVQAEGGIWNSGWFTPEKDGYFEVEVKLLQNANNFFIYTRDERGNTIETRPDSFFILKAPAVDDPPLPHTICVEFLAGERESEFEPVFKKGTRLPSEKTITCRAARTLRPGHFGEKPLNIKVFEGEQEDISLNEYIGTLEIRSEDIERKIPEGTEIELHFEIDQNRKLNVTAFVPLLDQWFANNMYVPEKQSVDETLGKNFGQLDECLADLEKQRKEAVRQKDEEKIEIIDRLISKGEQLQEQVYYSEQSQGDMTGLVGEVRGFLADAMETFISPPKEKEEKAAGLPALIPEIENLLDEVGDKDEEKEFEFLKKLREKAGQRNDPGTMKRFEKDMQELHTRLLLRRPSFWLEWYNYLARPGVRYVNQSLADKLLEKGEIAREEDIEELKKIVVELYALLEKTEQEKAAESKRPPGIRR
ncbi:MAG: Hsp70 family protein [Peptococcaceae bacterium]|nr:MAG: Hsp70 family protein [Peptococcaceae bacterium]